MITQQVAHLINELTLDIGLARAEAKDNPDEFREALLAGILFFPIFEGWPSPVSSWIEEEEQVLAQDPYGTEEVRAFLEIRRATIAMRHRDLAGALQILERVRGPSILRRASPWEATTRARVHIRAHAFAEVEEALLQAEALAERLVDPDDFIRCLLPVARAELALERNEPDAYEALIHALTNIRYDLVEERISLHQALAFVNVVRGDVTQALAHFTTAREILVGAGVQSEVLLMDLVCGSLHSVLGDAVAAERSFGEALRIAEAHPQPALEPLVRIAAARGKAAVGDYAQAVEHALEAARGFAEQGRVLGYVGMVSYLHALELEAGETEEAYRTLATGISIAKRLQLAGAEQVFRGLVNRMREVLLGPERFDRMVKEMIHKART